MKIYDKNKDIWNQIRKILESRLTKSEFETWFSRTYLKNLNSEIAVIGVPNKYVSSWLQDKHLHEITKSFGRVLKHSPEIHFFHDQPNPEQNLLKSQTTVTVDSNRRHNLNPSMTFDSYIMCEGNRFARSSAQEVASGLTNDFNPLYIHSNTAVGKTHLLHAIGNQALKKKPFSRISYLSSDTFTADFTYSIKNKKLQEFRDKYHNLDLILFDDIQLLESRKKTQEEFLSLFNALHRANNQIVISSDRLPNKLTKFQPHLKSRLGSGVLAEIQAPDQGTKIGIIKNKAMDDNLDLPEDIIFYLAHSSKDIKTLIQNLIRIQTLISLNDVEMNISMVKSVIEDSGRLEIGVEDVITTTARYFNISEFDLISEKRTRSCSYPRQLAMYIARRYTKLSYKDIGYSFGHKDHSTVIYAVKRIEKARNKEKKTMDDLDRIENLLK